MHSRKLFYQITLHNAYRIIFQALIQSWNFMMEVNCYLYSIYRVTIHFPPTSRISKTAQNTEKHKNTELVLFRKIHFKKWEGMGTPMIACWEGLTKGIRMTNCAPLRPSGQQLCMFRINKLSLMMFYGLFEDIFTKEIELISISWNVNKIRLEQHRLWECSSINYRSMICYVTFMVILSTYLLQLCI